MHRRRFLRAAIAGAASAALPACSPSRPAVHRVGFLNSGPASLNTSNVSAFEGGMREHGYLQGHNLVVDYRWAEQKIDRLPALSGELLALKPDVIVSTGGPATASALRAATRTVPVVFITGDPLHEKLVDDLGHPGGNMTGFSVIAASLEAKRLQLLKDALPTVRRVALLWNEDMRSSGDQTPESIAATAEHLGFDLRFWNVHDHAGLDTALPGIEADRPDALMVAADPMLGYERQRIVEFATRARLPGIYFWREFAEAGGLMSYGTDLTAMYRRCTDYVDKILRGAKPGDLPVEQPTTFEFVVNLRTARALGLTLPPSLLLLANKVIQ
jgi:putative ABC transport system substrate-binding protein